MSRPTFPPLEIAKKSITDFSKRLVPSQYIKAFEILLSPCCGVTVESVIAECTETPNVYSITLVMSGLPNLMGRGIFVLTEINDILAGGDPFGIIDDNTGTVLLPNILYTGSSGSNFEFNGFVIFRTRDDLVFSPSVTVALISTTITIPSC